MPGAGEVPPTQLGGWDRPRNATFGARIRLSSQEQQIKTAATRPQRGISWRQFAPHNKSGGRRTGKRLGTTPLTVLPDKRLHESGEGGTTHHQGKTAECVKRVPRMNTVWYLGANSNKSLQTETDTDLLPLQLRLAVQWRTLCLEFPTLNSITPVTCNVRQIRIGEGYYFGVSITKMDAKGGEG